MMPPENNSEFSRSRSTGPTRAIHQICNLLATSNVDRMMVENTRRELLEAQKFGLIKSPEAALLEQFAALPAQLVSSNAPALLSILSSLSAQIVMEEAPYNSAMLRLISTALCKQRELGFSIVEDTLSALHETVEVFPKGRYQHALFLAVANQLSVDKFYEHKRTLDLFLRLRRQYPLSSDMLDNFITTQSTEGRAFDDSNKMLSALLGHACIKTAIRQTPTREKETAHLARLVSVIKDAISDGRICIAVRIIPDAKIHHSTIHS